ncbi:hypothetical protein GCM10011501_29210 [Thalassotalea profundi]|uniref:Uncharacterized protein n=1 Tax=Thalassotalea profundi TaxID=2036687 RepID=A0ABQ3IXX3_9GAMM|nr:hypothetical protein GCM10011501_29210 [Thalassotalea profundi]
MRISHFNKPPIVIIDPITAKFKLNNKNENGIKIAEGKKESMK